MLDFLAERAIQEAIARGELDDLPGAGRPLELDDDALVPEELRLAYRILKNAGYVPEEVRTLKEIGELEALVSGGEVDAAARAKAVRKLALLKTRIDGAYYMKALARLGR
jgi:hypothetical protein